MKEELLEKVADGLREIADGVGRLKGRMDAVDDLPRLKSGQVDGREAGSMGYAPAQAAGYTVGQDYDFYSPPGGDKLYGKVVKKSGSSITFQVGNGEKSGGSSKNYTLKIHSGWK